MLPKQGVAGSNPVSRSNADVNRSWIASEDSAQNLSKECLLRQKITSTELPSLMSGYSLCAQTEGKSKNTVAIIANSITYLYDFLSRNGLSTDVTQIGAGEMRRFILYRSRRNTLVIL